MHPRRRLLVLSALPVLALAGPLAQARTSGTAEYRYRDTGRVSRRDNYQARLLALALDKTVARHGPYRLVRVRESFSPRRLDHEINEGRRINVFAAPLRAAGPGLAAVPHLAVPVPILDGLLGYRSLVIRRGDADRFARIATLGQLQHLRAGQGHDWLDARILRHNGFRVDDSGNLGNLLPMLDNGRFDYLPISIIEVDSLLERHPELAGRLMVAPGLAISYPLPSVFYVSSKFPDMAARLEQGLLMARQDGSFERLLQSSFRRELRQMADRHARHFRIANPFMPNP